MDVILKSGKKKAVNDKLGKILVKKGLVKKPRKVKQQKKEENEKDN